MWWLNVPMPLLAYRVMSNDGAERSTVGADPGRP
jgi:hypothetical protein